jgi:hypothetical protein
MRDSHEREIYLRNSESNNHLRSACCHTVTFLLKKEYVYYRTSYRNLKVHSKGTFQASFPPPKPVPVVVSVSKTLVVVVVTSVGHDRPCRFEEHFFFGIFVPSRFLFRLGDGALWSRSIIARIGEDSAVMQEGLALYRGDGRQIKGKKSSESFTFVFRFTSSASQTR